MMTPQEICQKLGPKKVQEMFLQLTADAMKKILREASLPAVRSSNVASTKRRNEEWARRFWQWLEGEPNAAGSATLLFEWLSRHRRPMLAAFLDEIEVEHQGGLTDADFLKNTDKAKLQKGAKKVLQGFDKAEVAAYLLFLDASNESDIFAPLELAQYLPDASR